jgi:hypothetical protein
MDHGTAVLWSIQIWMLWMQSNKPANKHLPHSQIPEHAHPTMQMSCSESMLECTAAAAQTANANQHCHITV